MQLFILLGPPGAGKGSLSQLCRERLGFEAISTGDLCRLHIERKTPIGMEIDFAVKSGTLISDSLIVDIFAQWLEGHLGRANTGLIIDGFPRTVSQAEKLAGLIAEKCLKFSVRVVRLVASEEEVSWRLERRYICNNQECGLIYSASTIQDCDEYSCNACSAVLIKRADDASALINKRLAVYRLHENPLLEAFKKLDWEILDVDADKPRESVFGQFVKIVDVGGG